jgi:hypothetical protein
MDQSQPSDLSYADFEAIRMRAIMGDGEATAFLAEMIRQKPADFAALLDMKAICLETMSRALSRGDELLKRDIDEQFAERLRDFENLKSGRPADAMQQMLVDVAAITDLRAIALAAHAQQPEYSEKTSEAFMVIANKARAAARIVSGKLLRRPAPKFGSGGPPLRLKSRNRISGAPPNWAAMNRVPPMGRRKKGS